MDKLSILLKPTGETSDSVLYIEGSHPQSFEAKNIDDFKAKLRVFLDDLKNLKFLDHLYFYETNDLTAEEKQRLKAYQAAAAQTIALIKSSFGSFEDSLLGIKNLFNNIDIALEKPDLKHLKISKPFSAVVVSAGSSLSLEFENLRKLQNKSLIICVDAVLKTLLKEGITPHLVTVVERDDYSIPFFNKLPAGLTTGLVAHPLVDKKIFQNFSGPIVTALKYTGACLWLPFDRAKFWTGSSSAHVAYRVAVGLGAERIAFVGQDLCFHPDTFQSHTTIEDYPEWHQPSSLEQRKIESNIIEVEGNTRKIVYSKPTWMMFANDFQIIFNEDSIPKVNTSKLGMKITGLPFQSLDDWMKDITQENINFSIPSQNPFLLEDKKKLYQKQQAAIEALQELKKEIKNCTQYEKLYAEILTRPHFLELVFEPVFSDWVQVENKKGSLKEFILKSEAAIDRVLEALRFKI